ncbi:hypothetical protein AKO1_001625 [Acrasis kona]|uniref:Metallo-beta-lactamase domain-containing protein n=1 Tax=Acrasis kona TaxID=1008807 RepID=A0AAW2ZCW3_9EUKA
MKSVVIFLFTLLIVNVCIAINPINVPVEIGKDFYNIRGDWFEVIQGVKYNLRTHMSLIRLASGKFLVIDTIEMNNELKSNIDKLTNNGSLIEAVVAVHPFHTTFFKPFYAIYNRTASGRPIRYFGTPRHLRNIKDVHWDGDLTNPSIRKLWNPEVDIQIPKATEFINPQPEESNHFSGAFAFHRPSKTVHIDDTFIYAEDDGPEVALLGAKKGDLIIHPDVDNGIKQYHNAPYEFRDWVYQIIKDFQFENILTAHCGNLIGGGYKKLQQTIDNASDLFKKLADKRKN